MSSTSGDGNPNFNSDWIQLNQLLYDITFRASRALVGRICRDVASIHFRVDRRKVEILITMLENADPACPNVGHIIKEALEPDFEVVILSRIIERGIIDWNPLTENRFHPGRLPPATKFYGLFKWATENSYEQDDDDENGDGDGQ